jgi:hypothetical protein
MRDRRRIVGGMLLLTVGGLLLLLPPVVYVFNHDIAVFGVPQIVFYLFGVWLALIGGTAALTSRLERDALDGEAEGEA